MDTSISLCLSTYTLCVDRVCSEEEGCQERGFGSEVESSPLFIVSQAANKYSKHVNHQSWDDSMEDNVQYMEAHRVQPSGQEVVQPATTRKGDD